MDSKLAELKENRIFALKIIAEAYLKSKGNTKTKEIFAKNKEAATTELVDGDVYVLHNYLMDEYRRMGLDLLKTIESTGEKIVPNKLSKFEANELITRADQLLMAMNVIKDYKKSNK